MRAVPADHDAASRESALRFTDENEHLSVLYDVNRPTLLDQMAKIARRARGDRTPPTREEILATFGSSHYV